MPAKALITGLLCAFLTLPGAASELCQRPGMSPPAAFRHAPSVPYAVHHTAGPCHSPDGCSGICRDGRWHIFIAAKYTGADYACALAHEKAHLPPNYWSPGHLNRKLVMAPALNC